MIAIYFLVRFVAAVGSLIALSYALRFLRGWPSGPPRRLLLAVIVVALVSSAVYGLTQMATSVMVYGPRFFSQWIWVPRVLSVASLLTQTASLAGAAAIVFFALRFRQELLLLRYRIDVAEALAAGPEQEWTGPAAGLEEGENA